MDAITLLKDDHRTVKGLFRRFEQAGDRAYRTKRRIVDRIIEELSVHDAGKEAVARLTGLAGKKRQASLRRPGERETVRPRPPGPAGRRPSRTTCPAAARR